VPGRFEVLRWGEGETEIVLDGAHNAGGMQALVESLPGFLADRPLVAVLSVLDDKDAAAMLAALLPLCAGAVFTANANPRALSPATLASLAGQVGAPAAIRLEGDPRRAVALACELASDVARERGSAGGAVVATGSIYLVADLMRPDGAGRRSTL
jgi:dihydrofolate synthase/folylpolyglutamate synthase